jgi:hypothetical protein
MIGSKMRSVSFSIILIIIVAVVIIGIFVAYYMSQSMGGVNKPSIVNTTNKPNIYNTTVNESQTMSSTNELSTNELSIFNTTVNEMISLADNFYGGSWSALDNGTLYAIYNGGGEYDVVYLNGTTATTTSQNVLYNQSSFLNTQSTEPPKTGIVIILSNTMENNAAAIMMFGYYWNSVPNPAQEAYEKILKESESGFYGATIGMSGNNVWVYSNRYGFGFYVEAGQNILIMILTGGINASSDQLQAFASKAEDLLNSLTS